MKDLELRRLKARIAELEEEREMLKKGSRVFCQGRPAKYTLIKEQSAGYGYRKKAYGYGWRFASEIQIKN